MRRFALASVVRGFTLHGNFESAAAPDHRPPGERGEAKRPSPALAAAAARSSSRRLFRGRTRWVYAVVLSLTFAAVIATAAQSYRAIDRELTELTLSRRAAVAQLAAATLSEKFARLVDLSVSLATRVRFRELVAEKKWVEASAILRDVPRNFSFVERLLLTDVEGTLMADVPVAPDVQGMSFAFREWYQGVRREWRPYVSAAYRRTAEPQINVFAVAAPIRNAAGGVAGILMVQVRVESLLEWLKQLEIEPEGFVYIVDSKGQIAFHSRYPGRDEIVDVSATPAVQRLLRGERGLDIVFDTLEGEDSIFAHAPVAGFGWGVVVQEPTRASRGLAARDQQLRQLLIAYGLILALCASAIYLASRIVLERRRAEEDRRMKAELEHRVAERTAQLEAANKELESFSYSVSHDLRAPLRAIDGFSRILEGDFSERLDNEGRRLLKVIRDSSRSMGQLIDDLLAFSRLGRKAVASARIDMRKLAEETLEEVEASAERRVKVVIGPLPPGYADAALIRQVWLNLLSNAVKFSSKREQPVVEVSGYEDERYNVYCVKDNGAGFDMQYYDKLFGVFQRLHDAGEFPGTGVGLATVRRVIAKHGGRVWAEGKVNEGAAFYFALPTRGSSHANQTL